MNTPNKITVGRIAATPIIAALIYQPGLYARWTTFLLFVAAAISDVIDGNLARDKDEITRFGQLLDPIADKLLVLVTFVPLYGIGLLPLWLVILVLGREIVITVFRRFALSRGQVIAASGWGKSKALVQNWFIGSVLVWRINLAYAEGGAAGAAWEHWEGYTLAVIAVGMWFVIVLTILSLIDYLVGYRHLWSRSAA
ncbi:MAG TPA: CDP-diacylglycerol--glycerol-3-phosphate 3-phosphatidyltransferase [Gemmatimonadota bacterium]|nr:CDP-diacylglycerol--glycerol-3-phosphate 3-phosphatidyltransferase [Gemmatimonadota bacterium]